MILPVLSLAARLFCFSILDQILSFSKIQHALLRRKSAADEMYNRIVKRNISRSRLRVSETYRPRDFTLVSREQRAIYQRVAHFPGIRFVNITG